MEKEKILQSFQDFLKEYDYLAKDEIWSEQSTAFKTFWNQQILNDQVTELNDADIDNIIRLIDRHARGNTHQNEAIARILIPQGVWRKMFNQVKEDKNLSGMLDQIMGTFDEDKRTKLINELYKYNDPFKNSLTGKKANALNAFLFLWAPTKNVSIVSLSDRQRLIQFFGFEGGPDFDKDAPGEKIVKSNKALISGFSSYFGSQYSPRTICVFLYHSSVIEQWRAEDIGEEPANGWSPKATSEYQEHIAPEPTHTSENHSLFYMESQLEDFIIENWDKTEFGQKYDLIEEDGEVVSQQYKIDIGRIDILAQDKKTQQLVVIELKKNQTSDDTVGQLARYMGWLEEHKTNSKPTKGIIIAAQYDTRLYYALKKLPGTEIYLYRVDFRLEEFKENYS